MGLSGGPGTRGYVSSPVGYRPLRSQARSSRRPEGPNPLAPKGANRKGGPLGVIRTSDPRHSKQSSRRSFTLSCVTSVGGTTTSEGTSGSTRSLNPCPSAIKRAMLTAEPAIVGL